jgi:hypothetical protein
MALQVGINLIPATIQSGQSLSAEADIGAQTLVGIMVPSTWTTAPMSFQVSIDDVAFVEFQSFEQSLPAASVAGGTYLAVDPQVWRGINIIKVRSGTLASPVNQTSTVTLELVVKSVD